MIVREDETPTKHQVLTGNCVELLPSFTTEVDLTFLDPPFNQQKDYALHHDDLPEEDYWTMMSAVCQGIFRSTKTGGALYFMQREKNTERVLRVLRETGWDFQNLIIWRKKTSAVPGQSRYGKQYQIIAFVTKGKRPRVFHRLRIEPPLLANQRHERENGVFVADVWDDIRELTSGYFAGDEALRNLDGARFHKQQAPLSLLLRIILSSTKPGDTVLDPFSGTGTTATVAKQLERSSISIDIDPQNAACIEKRVAHIRDADIIQKYYQEYVCTDNLAEIWGAPSDMTAPRKSKRKALLFDV